MKYQEWLNGCGCCPDIQDCPPSTGNPCDCDSILLELSKQHTDDLTLQDEIDNLDEKKLDASAYTPDEYATEEWVNEQGFLKTVEPLKTINGESLIGEGDIVISGGSGDAYTKEETDALLNDKQDTLTSGENIKTINNISILGSGNIEISGGSESKAIVAGRGIKVTTGETADTVAFDMPITDTNPLSPYFSNGYLKVNKPIAIGNGSLATMPTNEKFAVSQNNGDVSYATDFSVSGDGRIFIDDYHSKGRYGVRSAYCLQDKLDSLQPILSAGTGIDITDNVISATGGGESSGVTSGEVMDMISGYTYDKDTIDDKIAGGGTFDPTLYYKKSETSGKTEIQNALDLKLDASAFTESDYYKKSETSGKTELDAEFALYYKKSETSSKTEIDDALDNYYEKSETSGKTELSNEFALYYKKSETSGKTELDAAFSAITKTIDDNEQAVSEALNDLDDKKVESGDVVDIVSAYTYSKDEIDDKIASGGGITSGEVQTMIDESISGKTNNSDFSAHTANTSIHLTSGDIQTQIDNSISGKADSADVYTKAETSGKTELNAEFAKYYKKTETYTKTEVDNKFWCGTEAQWAQISGSTENGILYLIY